MLLLSTIATIVSAASVSAYCENTQTHNFTQFPYSFPYDTSIPQPYNYVNGCVYWNFEIPKQKYATVVVNSQFGSHDYFGIENSVGFEQFYNGYYPASIPQSGSAVYYFPADKDVQILLVQKSGNGGRLSFRVDLHDIVVGPYTQDNVTTFTANTIPLSNLIGNELRLKSTDKGPLLALSMVSTDLYDHRTDNCFIYEGPSCKDGTFIQSLGYLTLTNTLHSKDVAICCFSANLPNFYLIYTAKPDSMAQNDIWISRFSADRTASLNPLNNSKTVNVGMYLTTYCPGGCKEYVESVITSVIPLGPDFSNIYGNITKLSMYAGFPSSRFYKLTEMDVNQTSMYLPQEVSGIYRTYEVYASSLDLVISTNSSNWNKVNSPRKGFFMSANYPFIELSQNTTSFIASTPTTNFTIFGNSAVMDMGAGGVAMLYTDNGESAENSVTLPFNGTRFLKGSQISFTAVQGKGNGKGSLVFFEISPGPYSSSVSLSAISAIAAVVLQFSCKYW